MFASKSNRSSKSTIAADRIATAVFEELETRQLRSASPLNYTGSYLDVQNDSAIQVDFAKAGKNYSGQVEIGGDTYNCTAKEKNNKLSGTITDSSGDSEHFTAALHGQNMTMAVGGEKLTLNESIEHSGSDFNYSTPSNWTVAQSPDGLLITSPDGNLRLAEVSAPVDAVVSPQDIVNAAQQEGSTVLGSETLEDKTSDGVHEQQELVLLSFNDSNGNPFTTGLLIQTDSEAGQSVVTMTSVTAPTSQFAGDIQALSNVLSSTSVNDHSAKHTRDYDDYDDYSDDFYDDYSDYDFGGFYDPGVEGDWSDDGGFDYDSNPYLYDEQSSIAESSADFDAESDSFDDYLLS